MIITSFLATVFYSNHNHSSFLATQISAYLQAGDRSASIGILPICLFFPYWPPIRTAHYPHLQSLQCVHCNLFILRNIILCFYLNFGTDIIKHCEFLYYSFRIASDLLALKKSHGEVKTADVNHHFNTISFFNNLRFSVIFARNKYLG